MMLATERRRRINTALSQAQTVSTVDLATILGVSIETIRRDLVQLEEAGELTRVHGGATKLGHEAPLEAPYLERSQQNFAQKQAIGQAAAKLIRPDSVIIIDLGTTALEVARALPSDFTGVVATSSLLVANELANSSQATVLMAPGQLRRGDMAVSGIATCRFFEDLYADAAFLGIGALAPQSGITDFHLEEVHVKQAILGHSRRTYALAESTKLGKTARFRVCDMEDIWGVVTEIPPPLDILTALKKTQTEVIVP